MSKNSLGYHVIYILKLHYFTYQSFYRIYFNIWFQLEALRSRKLSLERCIVCLSFRKLNSSLKSMTYYVNVLYFALGSFLDYGPSRNFTQHETISPMLWFWKSWKLSGKRRRHRRNFDDPYFELGPFLDHGPCRKFIQHEFIFPTIYNVKGFWENRNVLIFVDVSTHVILGLVPLNEINGFIVTTICNMFHDFIIL